MNTLEMLFADEKLVEGHPIGIDKIIIGDLREKTWTEDG